MQCCWSVEVGCPGLCCASIWVMGWSSACAACSEICAVLLCFTQLFHTVAARRLQSMGLAGNVPADRAIVLFCAQVLLQWYHDPQQLLCLLRSTSTYSVTICASCTVAHSALTHSTPMYSMNTQGVVTCLPGGCNVHCSQGHVCHHHSSQSTLDPTMPHSGCSFGQHSGRGVL
jgi:hypothetical protein